MGFKLKVLINEWFANDMRQPIDLSQANDLEEFNKFKILSKQRSVLNLLTNQEKSKVPAWLKDELDIHFVKDIVTILTSDSHYKENRMLFKVASLRPLYKHLKNINKLKNVDELRIDDDDMDMMAIQSFMNRKHNIATIEGNLASDMLFKAISDRSLSITDIKHLESIAFSTPKEMIKLVRNTTDELSKSDISEKLDEKKRLFIKYALESIDVDKKVPDAFQALQQTYPKEMEEFVTALIVHPLARFSKKALKKPPQTYQIDKSIAHLAMIKKLSGLAKDIQSLIPDKAVPPEMMGFFYKESNEFLTKSYPIHQMKLDEEKEAFAKTQKIPFRLSLFYSLLGIGLSALSFTSMLSASTIFPAAMIIGSLGFIASQFILFSGYKNDKRRMPTLSSGFNINITFITVAIAIGIIFQPYAAIVVPCLLAILGGLMPLVSQQHRHSNVNAHINQTPLPQTSEVKNVIDTYKLNSMFMVQEEDNHVQFNNTMSKFAEEIMI
ncbi:MAG: hypothetical protein VX835_02795 [Pseudomonadota bacterium]|nr:hypothetical protein [Pseudomonadota bacterium]